MNKKLAAATTAISLSLVATQAFAQCDDTLSLYDPGADKSVVLAACFADKLKNNLDKAVLFNLFFECAAQAAIKDPALIRGMSDKEFNSFMDENFNMGTFEHELECHGEKLRKDPNYDPLSAVPEPQ